MDKVKVCAVILLVTVFSVSCTRNFDISCETCVSQNKTFFVGLYPKNRFMTYCVNKIGVVDIRSILLFRGCNKHECELMRLKKPICVVRDSVFEYFREENEQTHPLYIPILCLLVLLMLTSLVSIALKVQARLKARRILQT